MMPSDYTQILIDSISIPTIVIDTINFKVVLTNKAARDQIVRKYPISGSLSCCNIFPEKDSLCDQTTCLIRQVISTKAPVRILHNLHGDGVESFYDIVVTPIFNRKGEISQATMTIYDITDIKRTEKSSELFRYLIDESNDGVLIVDSQTGCFLDVNKKICTDLGYTREELLNMGFLDIKTEIHEGWSYEKLVDEAREKKNMIIEGSYRRKDNSNMPVELSLRYLTHEKKEYMVCIVRDIIRRRKAEKILHEQKEFATSLVRYSTIPTFVINSQHEIVHWNKASEELTGFDASDIVGTDWFYRSDNPSLADVVVSRELDEKIKHDKKYVGSTYLSNGLHSENWVPNVGGKKRYILFDAAPIYNSKNELVAALETMQDITEHKSAEDNLKKYAEKLEHSNELKDLFTDIMHHDLLNPAGIVKGYTELLLDIEKNKKKRQYLETIERNNEKLISIIERASNYAKLASIEVLEFEKMDIASLLKRVIENLRPNLEDKKMVVEFVTHGEYCANVNPVIEEAFSNLLCNAIKYSPKESRIIVDILDAGKEWKVSITDFGVGISDEDKSMLFERFRRLKKDAVKGTGLGLAIVKRLTTLHGGRVGVGDNPEGQGSVFWITLRKA